MSPSPSPNAGTLTRPAAWEQQTDESAVAYEAFRLYRDTEPGDRSLRDVAGRLHKSGTLIGRWSSRHRWVERCASWDGEQDRLWREGLVRQRRKAIDRHLNLARAAQNKVAEALLALNGADLSPAELTRLFEVTTRIEREALGEPQRHEVTGPDGSPLEVRMSVLAGLPTEERHRRVMQLADEVRRRAEAASGVADDDE